MRALSFGLLFLISTIVAGCGGGTSEAPPIFPETPRSETTQLSYDLNAEIDQFSVTCNEAEGCPEAVGMMVASEDDYAYRCSGFLVSEDVFVTSGHCIPKDLREKGKSCRGRAYFLFPTKDGKTKKVECSELENFNVSESSLYDYAFFKMKRSASLKPFNVNQDNRVNFQNVTIWKVNPHRDKGGRIFSTDCKLQQKAIGSEFFDGPRTGVVNYSGCLTRKGNSGSAVLNTKGEVIAIHQSSLKTFSTLGKVLTRYIRTRDFFPSGSATNFGCLCKKGDAWSHQCQEQAETCKTEFTNTELDMRRNLLLREAIKRYLTPEIKDELFQGIPSAEWNLFQYDVSSGFRILYDKISNDPVDLKIYAALVPTCIKNRSYVINNSHSLSIPNYQFDRSVTIRNAPLCPVEFRLNKRLQIENMEIDTTKCSRGFMYFDFMNADIYQNSTPMIQVWSAGSFGEVGVPFSQGYQLKVCE
ncbi:MAG: serine protease [Deltaproteobacteria bacterium]|nr:MAG: serine protease [Deltaproteobacteria bacterium]TNF26665.1 MAG: serine protease [Deltaproteobacteria bacterium]